MLSSSFNMLNSFGNASVNSLFSPSYFPRDESSNQSSTTLKSTRNISNDSTSAPFKGLNGSRLLQKQQLKQKRSGSPLSFPSSQCETGRSTEGSEAPEMEDLSTRFEDSDLDLVKKKVKTETESTFTDFLSTISSKNYLMTRILEDDLENVSEAEDLDSLFTTENDKVGYKLWENKTEHIQRGFSSEDFHAAVELLNVKYSNSQQDELPKNKTVSYSFYSAPEEPSPILINQIGSLNGDENQFSSQNQEAVNVQPEKIVEEAKVPSIQLGSPTSLKEGHQILKDALDSITSSDMQRLDPDIYLNDNLLNFYLKLIEYGFLSEERRKKCHFFNTYFMSKMIKLFNESGRDFTKFNSVYENMGKWTKKINLFEKDFLFVPINENEHWNLLVVCYPHRMFSKDGSAPFVICLDSISRMDNVYVKMLFQFFLRDLRTKMPKEFSVVQSNIRAFNLTTFPYVQQMVPKQSNSSDCGLYLLHYVEMFSEDESYILNNKEDLFKMRWFPRKMIDSKRKDIKKLIDNLKSNRFEIINEYLRARNQRFRDHQNKKDQFDSFSQQAFERALAKTHAGKEFTDGEKKCLMLDFYYFGTLDFDQLPGFQRSN